MMPLTTAEITYVRDFVRSRLAIVLDDKEYLIESRLASLAVKEGLNNATTLVRSAQEFGGGRLREKILDALTTNETLFFRDIHPFTALERQIIPELISRNKPKQRLRFWCAACSSGQEPYSLAMLLRSGFPQLANWNVEIIATDFSETILARARQGRFSQAEVNRGLPAPMLVRFFDQIEGGDWQIDASVRQMIQFRRLNLIEQLPIDGPFDLILLRNVLIYFDQEVRRNIVARCIERMGPQSYLLLGAAESGIGLTDKLTNVQVGKTVLLQKK